MKWTRTITTGGEIHTEEGHVVNQEIDNVTIICKQTDAPTSSVSTTVQRSAEYGEVKCSVTITLTCPQDAAWVNHTAKVGFKAALGFCNDGFSWLCPGAPRLEGPE